MNIYDAAEPTVVTLAACGILRNSQLLVEKSLAKIKIFRKKAANDLY